MKVFVLGILSSKCSRTPRRPCTIQQIPQTHKHKHTHTHVFFIQNWLGNIIFLVVYLLFRLSYDTNKTWGKYSILASLHFPFFDNFRLLNRSCSPLKSCTKIKMNLSVNFSKHVPVFVYNFNAHACK